MDFCFFLLLSSIGLGAPLGLLLTLQKSFFTFQFYFRRMSLLGWIFVFLFLSSIGLGALLGLLLKLQKFILFNFNFLFL